MPVEFCSDHLLLLSFFFGKVNRHENIVCAVFHCVDLSIDLFGLVLVAREALGRAKPFKSMQFPCHSSAIPLAATSKSNLSGRVTWKVVMCTKNHF